MRDRLPGFYAYLEVRRPDGTTVLMSDSSTRPQTRSMTFPSAGKP